eukprot:1366914-Amphidinium_carterae.1
MNSLFCGRSAPSEKANSSFKTNLLDRTFTTFRVFAWMPAKPRKIACNNRGCLPWHAHCVRCYCWPLALGGSSLKRVFTFRLMPEGRCPCSRVEGLYSWPVYVLQSSSEAMCQDCYLIRSRMCLMHSAEYNSMNT